MARDLLLRVLETSAKGFSGAVAYYACEALSDCFTFKEGVNAQVARLFFWVFFPFLAIVAFVLLTMAWHRVPSYQGSVRYPEVSIIIGATIFMPVYFELASHLIYNPTPILASEVAEDLLSMYMLFPLTVIEVGTYTGSLHVLPLAAVSALVTGYLLRRRVRRTAIGSH
jgi:hypothetical protein